MTFRVYRGHSSELGDTSEEHLPTEAQACCQETKFEGHTNPGFGSNLCDRVSWSK